MSDNLDTVEDSKKTLTADVTDDSCMTKIIEIVPLDRTSDNHHRPEFIYPVVEVKSEDLQDVKQETADENDTEDSRYSVKQEPADYDNTDVLQCLMKVRFCMCSHLLT